MSPFELRYLIASNELAEGDRAVRQKDVADRLRVSKVSAYNAIERLKEKGLLEKKRKVRGSDRGRKERSGRIYDHNRILFPCIFQNIAGRRKKEPTRTL